jgi:predicted DNA-binding protein
MGVKQMAVTSIQMPVKVPPELKRMIEDEAKRTGLSQSDIVRLAIRKYFNDKQAEH